MKAITITNILLSLMIFCLISSCKKEGDKQQSGGCNNQGTFTLTLDGSAWTASSFNNTLVIATTGGVDAKRMDIRAIADDGSQLVITFNDLSTGLNGDGVNPNADYIATDDITSSSQNAFFVTLYKGGIANAVATEGTLDITSCDEASKTVSGTFTFRGDYTNLDDFIGTQGSFSNLCYTVSR